MERFGEQGFLTGFWRVFVGVQGIKPAGIA
jgi:hypothetical protein